MKLTLPRYTTKDYAVLGIIILPITLIINIVIFGKEYFGKWQIFLFATFVTAAGFSINFIVCGWVATQMKKHFPSKQQVGLRLTLMIISFILITGLFLFAFFRGYELVPFLHYNFNESGFIWAYVCMAIINIFLTLLMEALGRFESWKQNLTETEQLKRAFRQSQLQGLKSQVNPHFLFNSLNTLSSLIAEDEEKAEKFLNEMTKVYRYMLRSDDEPLVTLDTELKFIESYLYLLKARFGDGIDLKLEVAERDRLRLIPALSLQVLLENAFTRNTVSKLSPLSVEICSCAGDRVLIKHNRQEKTLKSENDTDTGLDNLVKKYALLDQSGVDIEEDKLECCYKLPLIMQKEEVAI